jgi:hypothetical protein
MLLKPKLLFPHPGEFAEREGPQDVIAKMPRRRQPHPSLRRMDAEVHVLDFLADHFDGQVAEMH